MIIYFWIGQVNKAQWFLLPKQIGAVWSEPLRTFPEVFHGNELPGIFLKSFFFLYFCHAMPFLLYHNRRVSHNVVAIETSAIGWPPWLIPFWYLWIWRNHVNASMHEHVQLFRNQWVSKCNQSRWPSNCTGFHSHHVMWKESIGWSLVRIVHPFSWDSHDISLCVLKPLVYIP